MILEQVTWDVAVPQLFDALYDAVYMLDRDMRVVFWNRSAATMTGYRPDQMIGRKCDDSLAHCLGDGKVLCHQGCPMQLAIASGAVTETSVFLRHREGHRVRVSVRVCPVRDAAGEVIGAMQVFSDDLPRIVAIRRLGQLEQMATNDVLTGLRNRRFMEEQIVLRLGELRRIGDPVGGIYLDLDHFKGINDRYGHELGDQAMRVVAETLKSCADPLDVVGRWGGDEILMLVGGAKNDNLRAIAEGVCGLVRSCRLEREGEPVPLTVSIGATRGRPGDRPSDLLGRLDQLMYRSKQLGRDRVCDDTAPG